MTDLIVIVPSRGRPAAISALSSAFAETCTVETLLVAAVDNDDPYLDSYLATAALHGRDVFASDSHTMVEALNAAALLAAEAAPAVAFMGDDHRPRTRGWDRQYLAALSELGTGIVYGDDLLQHEAIPTQVAMTSDIIKALGFMAPPPLTHLFVDNYWLALGKAADCLRYLPDVVVEHMHPIAHKVAWDEGHVRVNAPAMYEKDAAAYSTFVSDGRFEVDVAKVKALR